jgi:hypothetical protein
MMQYLSLLRTRLRTLALGSLLTLAVLGLPAVSAHAEDNNGGSGGNEPACTITDDSTDPPTIEFMLPGDTIRIDGVLIKCLDNGELLPVAGIVRIPPAHPILPSSGGAKRIP